LPFQQCFPESSPVLKLSTLKYNEITLNQNWKFHPGDNPSWADPYFDDRHWSPIDPTTDIHYLTDLREAGIGWFRLDLAIDTSMLNIPLAMTIFQRGASEIYLNGKLIHTLGVSSKDPKKEVIFNPNFTPYSFQFEDHTNQVGCAFFIYREEPLYEFPGAMGWQSSFNYPIGSNG
jgi:hypothetical protein